MAYEYEEPLTKKFNEEYKAGRIPNLDLFNELKEVYAKAKAFDEIKKLRNSYYTYSKRDSGGLIALLDAKPFGREVSHLINKKEYTEDE
ncbi:hypothetical protein [Mammaliicoccus sciuri]|uniref:hypothetical protein n=1 Tax=Mammaliicoccus sciuri TaxID=1296 RepID=UPI001953BC56|nr:hypothetical protein [Mammaliicoccus sciuri]